jgi:hypothetical protein
MYLSLANTGPYTVGTVTGVDDEDILSFNGSSFAMFFDGSDVGLSGLDVDAFFLLDADSLLLSFDLAATIGSLGLVDDSDIVRFDASTLGSTTAGTFSLYFDASDVGLTTGGEDVDAIEILSNGNLVVSTVDTFAVTGASGEDEDLIAFTPTSLGSVTSGTWALYFDGSDVGLSTSGSEDLDAAGVAANGNLYLSTLGAFSVSGVSGAGEDVFICTPTSLGATTACTFSPTLFFDGSAWGLAGNTVDGVELP